MAFLSRCGLLSLGLAFACDGGGSELEAQGLDGGESGEAAAAGGEEIYENPVADGNTFSCATCHAVAEPTADGLRRPGHPIGDAAARPSYKNGHVSELREAVNSCLSEWMNAEPWAADDPRWVSLSDWLDEIAPAEAPALSFQIAAPPTDLAGGDPDAGRATFNASCAVCHGPDGGGTQLAPPVSGRDLDPTYAAERVRRSGRADSGVYDGLTGGIMPFWSADRLSDDELRDIAAWLADSDPAPPAPEPEPEPTGDGGDTGPAPGTCGSDHPRVGQTAELQAFFHDVGGTAEILDDCTIELRDFTYDGTGIDVRIYAGLDGDYDNGFSISDDLLSPTPYAGDTLTLTLPAGTTLDDLDGISVWCVTVGIDFGSGMFQ